MRFTKNRKMTMTDREFLQNLKSMLDAQLGTIVIPVHDPVTSSPGGPPPANVPQQGSYWWGDWSQPSNGLDIYQYATPGTADGVPLGFTGTYKGKNYVNGNPWTPEYTSQGTDPNKPSFAFESWLRHYGLGWYNMG